MKDFTLKTKLFLFAIWIGGIILLVWNFFHLTPQNLLMLVILSILGSLSLILRVAGSTNRSHYSINFLIYGFTIVLLGTPAAVLVILVSNLVDWIWHKSAWFIQLFNIGCYIIAVQATGLVINWINPSREFASANEVIAIVIGMAVFTLLNHLMVGMALLLARGENFKQSGMFEIISMMIDLTLLIMGGSLVLMWQFNQYAVLLFLIPLYLIYSTLKVPALERKADTDPKTGLYNHRYFEKHMENELHRANRFDRPLALIMADLDLLRNINNTYGHLAGDEVLIGIAKILKQSVREYDVVARFGGEEFSILLPEVSVEYAYERAEMIRHMIEKAEFSVPTSVSPIRVTMSFGIAGREGFSQSPQEIIHDADTALYHSKLEGRNRTFVSFQGNYRTYSGGLEQTIRVYEKPVEITSTPIEPPQPVKTLQESDLVNTPTPMKVEPIPVPAPAKPAPVKRGLSVNIYIGLVVLMAGVMFFIGYKPYSPLDWLGLIAFTFMVVVTEWFSIDIYVNNTSVSTSAAPILAGTLLFGPWGALVLSTAFALTALLKFSSPFSRFIFNLSNQLLAGMLYLGLISVLNIQYTQMPSHIQVVVCTITALLVYISTTTLISTGMHLDMQIPFRQIWQEKFSWLAPYYLCLGVVAYTLSYGYYTAGLMGLAVILVPLLLIRWSQKQYVDRTREMVTELRDKNLKLEKNTEEISQLNEGLLDTLAEVIDLRDPYVLGHSRQVTRYAVMIAKAIGLNKKQTELIHKASLLHDVGKLGISEAILSKTARLTPAEYEKMKAHPRLGAEILRRSSSLVPLIPIVEHHHEHFDGSGYPSGLVGHDIPIEARIVAVADAIEAMASDRPYRKSLSYESIRTELIRCSGTHFDPQVVAIALRIIETDKKNVAYNMGQPTKIGDAIPLPAHNPVGD